MRRNRARPSHNGFTLVEALVAVAIISILASATVPTIRTLVHRSQVLGISRDTASFMRRARLEAIRASLPAQVRIDTDALQIMAFVDEDADGVFDNGERRLGVRTLPPQVSFGAPGGLEGTDSVYGFEVQGVEALAVFNPDGSAVAEGAIRYRDGRGNYLEVRAAPRTTARVEIRKFDEGFGSWHGAGEGGVPWSWK